MFLNGRTLYELSVLSRCVRTSVEDFRASSGLFLHLWSSWVCQRKDEPSKASWDIVNRERHNGLVVNKQRWAVPKVVSLGLSLTAEDGSRLWGPLFCLILNPQICTLTTVRILNSFASKIYYSIWTSLSQITGMRRLWDRFNCGGN